MNRKKPKPYQNHDEVFMYLHYNNLIRVNDYDYYDEFLDYLEYTDEDNG